MRMFQSNAYAKRRGQTIVEALVAVGVLSVGLMGIIALTTRALSEERTIADDFRASYLATEGIEIARNIIDGNYLTQGNLWNQCDVSKNPCAGAYSSLDYTSTAKNLAPALSSPQCDWSINSLLHFDLTSGLYVHSTGNPDQSDIFHRCVTITKLSNDELRIVSEVQWSSRGTPMTMSVEDHFFDWRPH